MLSQRTWEAALGVLQVEIPKADFAAWFDHAEFVSATEQELVVGVPTVFAKETVERKYRPIVSRAVSQASGRDVDVTIVVRQDNGASSAPALLPREAAAPTRRPTPDATLHPRFTFDNYVIGSTNRLAHAAALRVSESPGRAYNPLFMYSGVGLGKTHLLHSIGHAISAHDAQARVRYVPCEAFTNDLLLAIRADVRTDRTRRFRARYRDVDVLLIDDVEFLARSETSQEELFHTFNTLYEGGRQIVLTSDRPPSEIRPLADRLRSRFGAGLVADIQAPDLDLRRGILESRTASSHTQVEPAVIDYIADRVRRNVRELEGALARALLYAELNGLELTPATAGQALDGIGLSDSRRPPATADVIDVVSDYFAVPTAELTGPRRDARVVAARQVAMYLLRKDAALTLPQIGRELGGRDHTTALHGCKKIERRLQLDDRLKSDIDTLRARLANLG